jgi:hypothetical protein
MNSAVEYATISGQRVGGYAVADTTGPRLYNGIIHLALPSGSKWLDAAYHRCVKVSLFPGHFVGVSASIILPDEDAAGRPGLIYTNVALLGLGDWLLRLRIGRTLKQTTADVFQDFPFTGNKLELFFDTWQSATTSFAVSPISLLLQKLKTFAGRRVIVKGAISTPQGWEQFANHVFGLAQFAARYHRFVSFTTLTLNIGDTSQVIAIPDELE